MSSQKHLSSSDSSCKDCCRSCIHNCTLAETVTKKLTDLVLCPTYRELHQLVTSVTTVSLMYYCTAKFIFSPAHAVLSNKISSDLKHNNFDDYLGKHQLWLEAEFRCQVQDHLKIVISTRLLQYIYISSTIYSFGFSATASIKLLACG